MSQSKEKKVSQARRAFVEDGAKKTHVGGQALIEGVMMRGKYNWAVAVREPDGNIYTEEHDLMSGQTKNGWLHWPVVRGCTSFVESLGLGFKALEIAAMHAYDDEEESGSEVLAEQGSAEHAPVEQACVEGELVEDAAAEAMPAENGPVVGSFASDAPASVAADAVPAENKLAEDAPAVCAPVEPTPAQGACEAESMPLSKKELRAQEKAAKKAAKAQKTGKQEKSDDEIFEKVMSVSMVLGVILGVVLFVVLPAVLTNLIVGEYDDKTFLWNVVDGLIRVAIFVFYIWLIGRMKDIDRMFCYHGAEHKTIHCYEHGLELTPENARQFPRLHVRCGTAFLIMVMIIAILVYTILPVNPLIEAWGVPDGVLKLLLVIAIRILFLPVIAGISYEITVKWAGSHPDNWLVKIILWPGMQMQYLTTHEPDDGMLECAIASMKLVLEREEREARKNAGTDDTGQTPEPQAQVGSCSCF